MYILGDPIVYCGALEDVEGLNVDLSTWSSTIVRIHWFSSHLSNPRLLKQWLMENTQSSLVVIGRYDNSIDRFQDTLYHQDPIILMRIKLSFP